MNFSDFLKQRQRNKSIPTISDHFEDLGGQKKLGITLRYFQQIASGSRPPTVELLSALMPNLSGSEKRSAVMTFFRSALKVSEEESNPVLDYLGQYLTPAIEKETKSIWDNTKKSQLMFNDEQLRFLIANDSALKVHQRAIMFDKVNLSESRLTPLALEEMVRLNLLRVEGTYAYPSKDLFRIPTFENAGPRSVEKGTEYIFRFLDLFCSKEGSPLQQLHCTLQLVSAKVSPRILEQLKDFKSWVQSLSEEPSNPDAVPFLFLGIAKQMDKKELL